MGKNSAKASASGCCSCRGVETKFKGWLSHFGRRRVSYMYWFFYTAQTMCFLVTFIFGVVLYSRLTHTVNKLEANCLMDPLPKTLDDLRNATLSQRRAVKCNSADNFPACEYRDFALILDGIIAYAVAGIIQTVVSALMALCFRYFKDLPAETLQSEKANRWTLFLGGICKQGPWLSRFVHLGQGIMLVVCMVLVVRGICVHELDSTDNCAQFRPDCAYNKLVNCLYYYKYCTPSWDNPAVDAVHWGCFKAFQKGADADSRHAFSGLMDIRLIPDKCVKCKILELDKDDQINQASFWLPPEGAACSASRCFKTTTKVQDCKMEVLGGDTLDWQAPEALEKQECSSAPNTVIPGLRGGPYFFRKDKCYSTKGSLTYRLTSLFMYLQSLNWLFFTLVGQALRTSVTQEPWFFQPPRRHEFKFKLFLRKVAP